MKSTQNTLVQPKALNGGLDDDCDSVNDPESEEGGDDWMFQTFEQHKHRKKVSVPSKNECGAQEFSQFMKDLNLQ